MVKPANLGEVDGRLRGLEAHVLHGVGDDLRHREIAEPLLIGRDDVPGGVLLRAVRQRVLESLDVIVPAIALAVIGRADLPLPRGIVEALLEPRELLLLRDVEEELEDRRLVLDMQQLLEAVDQVVTSPPDRLWNELVDAHDQHVLVVGAIEHGHFALARRVRMDAPEEVMVALRGRRLLEARDLHALRIHGADHVPAGAVLAGPVDALQDDQQGP